MVVMNNNCVTVVTGAAVDFKAVANWPDPSEEEERNCQDLEYAPNDAPAAVAPADAVDDGPWAWYNAVEDEAGKGSTPVHGRDRAVSGADAITAHLILYYNNNECIILSIKKSFLIR